MNNDYEKLIKELVKFDAKIHRSLTSELRFTEALGVNAVKNWGRIVDLVNRIQLSANK